MLSHSAKSNKIPNFQSNNGETLNNNNKLICCCHCLGLQLQSNQSKLLSSVINRMSEQYIAKLTRSIIRIGLYKQFIYWFGNFPFFMVVFRFQQPIGPNFKQKIVKKIANLLLFCTNLRLYWRQSEQEKNETVCQLNNLDTDHSDVNCVRARSLHFFFL